MSTKGQKEIYKKKNNQLIHISTMYQIPNGMVLHL